MAEDTNEFFEEQLSNQRKSHEVAQDVGADLSKGLQKINKQLRENNDEQDGRNTLDRIIQLQQVRANKKRNQILLEIEEDADRREEARAQRAEALTQKSLNLDEAIQPQILASSVELRETFERFLNAAMVTEQLQREAFDSDEAYAKALNDQVEKQSLTMEELLGLTRFQGENLIKQLRGDTEEEIKNQKQQRKENKAREKTNQLLAEQIGILKEGPDGILGFLAKLIGIPIAAAGLFIGFIEGFIGFFVDLGKFVKGRVSADLTRTKDFFRSIGNFFRSIGNFAKTGVLYNLGLAFDKIKVISAPFINFFNNLKIGGLMIFEDIAKRFNSLTKSLKSLLFAINFQIGQLMQSKFVKNVKNVFAGIKNFFTGTFGFVAEQIRKIKAPFETIFGSGSGGSGGVLQRIMSPFMAIGENLKRFFPFLKQIFPVFRSIGGALGRLSGIGTIIFAFIDGLTGLFKKFKDGFQSESILGNIYEGITATLNGIFSGFVGGLLNLVGLIGGALLRLFGFDEIGKKLMEFNFIDILFNGIQPIFDFLATVVDAIGLLPAAVIAAGKALPPGGKSPGDEFMRVMGQSKIFGGGAAPDTQLQAAQAESEATKNELGNLEVQTQNNTSVDQSTINNTQYNDSTPKLDRTAYQFGAPFTGLAYN